MIEFAKSNLTVDGSHVSFSVPISKVDQKTRTVSGWATLDNVDSQGDVVTAEASMKAFQRARGNLREMHDKVAVGKIVDFREDEFYDTESKKFFRGIFVTAYISEGAENTWIKVNDGTLTGFSIGGEINDSESEFVKDAGDNGKTVRFIKDYDLVELSLVDNPANQLANVFSIQKAANGSVTLKGMAIDTVLENVFKCKTDHTISVHSDEKAICPLCSNKMENIGWFESNNNNRAEKVRSIIEKHDSFEAEAAPDDDKGGADMSKKNDEVLKAADVDETPEAEPVEGTVEENLPVEEPTEVDEVDDGNDDASEISKKVDELKEVVTSSMEKTRDETRTLVEDLEKKVDEVNETFLAKTSELHNRLDEYNNKLETTKGRIASLESELQKVNSSTAFRKSSDIESEAVTPRHEDEDGWHGAFSHNQLFKR